MNNKSLSFLLITLSIGLFAQSPKHEFRGIWVSTVNNLDWPSSSKLSTEQQKEEFIKILDNLQEFNINAVFVQVRAAGDAFYPSKIEPWSVWLTGKQGKAPEPYYDPLQFMIEACHKRNIEFHAWFNLVRGVSHMRFFPASKDHIFTKHPEWFFEIGERRFFNQGIPEVRDYTINVILDVVNRYSQIDGVHLDDYFYPEEIRQKKLTDRSTFDKYKGTFTDIDAWRRHNIDTLVFSLSDSINKINPDIKFGISPVSVWRHKHLDPTGSDTKLSLCAYDDLCADTKKWIELDWIDYIIPQNYGNTASNIVKHKSITDWWGSLDTDRHRYIGNALYKWGTDSWSEWKRSNEIPLQISIQRDNSGLKGNALFRYQSLLLLPKPLKESLQQSYNQLALTPSMDWKCEDLLPEAPFDVVSSSENDSLSIEIHSDNEKDKFLVYGFEKGESLNISNFNNLLSFTDQGKLQIWIDPKIKKIIITTVDKCNRESEDFFGFKIKK